MERLVLHIGTHKTGTTSLQKFFWLNRNELAAQGIDYPWFFGEYQPSGKHFKNGTFLAMHGRDLTAAEMAAAQRKVSRSDASAFRRYATSKHTWEGSTLLSEEGFYGSCANEKFWPVVADFLFRDCGIKRVEIVVYLRRQDLYAVSLWKQYVKMPFRRTGHENFKDYLKHLETRVRLDYDTALARIEACFGRDAVIVRRYAPRSFVGGDIFHDFCAAINIPWDAGFVMPERRENPSLNCTVTEVKRLVNMAESYRDVRAENFLQAPALLASLAYPEPPGLTPLSPEEAEALLAEYEEGNRRVSERYLGGEPLFPEPYQFGPTWQRDDAAVLDAAITMFAEALARQQIRINHLERLVGMPLLLRVKRYLSRVPSRKG